MPRKQPVPVDLDVPLPERVIGLHQRGRLVDSGVVDQAVQAAELLGRFDGAGPIGFRGHIVPDEGRSRPELDSQRLALIVQHVPDHYLRTLRYQQAGLCGTLAARPAAHEHHLVVEACHVRSPRLSTAKFGRSDRLVQSLLMLGDNRRAAAVGAACLRLRNGDRAPFPFIRRLGRRATLRGIEARKARRSAAPSPFITNLLPFRRPPGRPHLPRDQWR